MQIDKADPTSGHGGGRSAGGSGCCGEISWKGGETSSVFVLCVMVAPSVVETMALAMTLLVQVRGPRHFHAV